ncbi:type 2 DNA topoisomerase 6 subunit B-like isoform X2 [Fukomys damarensis]|uniref:type 2 DNA topoisomerase 6 subunit B-like isoform X2 n=1 Tax=Fukomys damarensis TaxID=885580 RepID=UPI00053F375B|nr:type 2 DNA topoisomerase 6 subunit B-like isoform X2 [Fukomys damarensis]
MERTALAVCEILRYLIIHWRCETETSNGALLEGQLVISIEALNSKHQPNALHCVTTIASVRSICGGLVLKKFLKEIQSILRGFSAKLICTSEENSCFPGTSGVTPFQITFEINEKPRGLMIDCLVIKQFLHKIIIVHHKIRFTLSVKVNGFLSTEIFGMENEPTLNLSNGITIVVNCQHYVSRLKFSTAESHCSRIHPVLGHPVTLLIPEDVAGMDLLGNLIMTPAAALCPSPKVFSSQLSRISSVSIFLYGPSGLPLILSNEDQLSTTVFKDTFYFIDWKKYHLCVVPNLDLNLDKDLVLPDVSYQVESSERGQSQIMHLQGQTLLLFLFVDFHSGFPVQQMEIWGVHTLLTAHLSAILTESHTVIQDSIHFTLDQILEERDQAAKAHQKLQASLSVAVSSIMSVVTGSTSGSFRKTCLQALQAADTQEFGTKLHKIFCDITQHRFLHHCSSNMKQLIPEKNNSAQSTEDAHESGSPELLAEISRQAQRKRPKSDSFCHGQEETLAFMTSHRAEPHDASLTPREEEARTVHDRAPAPERASSGSGLEDALWLQEVSNLSEWLSPGSGS